MLSAFSAALDLLVAPDQQFLGIVALSLRVSLTAVLISALVALPLGAALALARFPGRGVIVVTMDAFMGFPPVVAGLLIYLLFSRAGLLGGLGWLFTPKAMIAAQACLALPIIAALTRQTIEDLWTEYREHLTSIGSSRLRSVPTLLWDGRFSLITAVLAGLGRASGEVGAILLVGGNIAGHTRTMTTAIALETSKGDLAQAVGLGLVLISLMILINAAIRLAGQAARAVAE